MNRRNIHIDPACAVYVFIALPLSAVVMVGLLVALAKALGWLA
ncbi:MAG TPA: hypothetical protein VEC57_14615 [Candidatus Limnocylindrales bacterium]|nr:hypothetical protein [Candidatus Limnocylindrales bacterium]